MSLEAGGLRHRVNIQKRVQTQDPVSGEILINWEDVFSNVPAKIEPLSAKEFLASRTENSQVSARITIRYRAGIDASMRIVHRIKIYNIEGWLPDKDSGLEYITLPCSQGTNEG